MTRLERQRFAIALSHAVDGAAVTLHCESGEQVVVAHHPAADLSPCTARRAFLTSRRRSAGGSGFDRVVDVRLGGSLIELGAGVVGTRSADGRLHRWVATTLDTMACVDLLEGLEEDTDDVVAIVAPDAELGVTIVHLSADRDHLGRLERTAVAIAAAALTAELIGEVSRPRTAGR